MNLVPVFVAVIAIHIGIIGLLMVTPGCQSTEPEAPAEASTSPVGEPVRPVAPPEEPPEAAPVATTPAYPTRPAPPTRPTQSWNLNEATEPVPLPGTEPTPSRPGENRGLNAPEVAEFSEESEEAAPVLQPIVRPSAAPPATTTTAPSGATYTVRPGDNLSRIARMHGTTVTALREANALEGDLIRVDQTLVIPTETDASSTVAPPAQAAATSSAPTVGSEQVYTVVGGDSLSRIARRFGTTVTAIRQANGLTSDLIRVGQALKIPSPGEAVAPTGPSGNESSSGATTYEVQSGDTLGAISRRFAVGLADLRRANNLTGDLIRVGQVLTIPTGAETRPEAASPQAQPRPTTANPTRSTPTEAPPLPDDDEPTPASPSQTDDDGLDDLDDAPLTPVRRAN